MKFARRRFGDRTVPVLETVGNGVRRGFGPGMPMRNLVARGGRKGDMGLRSIHGSGPLVAGSTRRQYRERLAQLAAMADTGPDQVERSLKEQNAPHGHWDEVAATIAGYEKAGIRRFYIQVLGDTSPAAVEADLEALESV